MDKGEEMIDEAIPAHHHALVFVQSGEQVFDLPSPPIAPQSSVALGRGPAAIGPIGRDQRNALASEALIERITVVGTILP